MKANELRIGNWVNDKEGNICQIRSIDSERQSRLKDVSYIGASTVFIKKYNGTVGQWIGTLSPIPLTEEILLKCGFVKMDSKHNFFILGYEINFKIDKKIKWVAWCNTVLANVQIKYLHQLQNLYFALTSEELEVKVMTI